MAWDFGPHCIELDALVERQFVQCMTASHNLTIKWCMMKGKERTPIVGISLPLCCYHGCMATVSKDPSSTNSLQMRRETCSKGLGPFNAHHLDISLNSRIGIEPKTMAKHGSKWTGSSWSSECGMPSFKRDLWLLIVCPLSSSSILFQTLSGSPGKSIQWSILLAASFPNRYAMQRQEERVSKPLGRA